MNITLASTFCLFLPANRLYHCILHPVEAVHFASTLPSLQFIPELSFISGQKGTQNKGGFGIRKYAIADYQAVTV